MAVDLKRSVIIQESIVREGTSQLKITLPNVVADLRGWKKGDKLELTCLDGSDKVVLERDYRE